LNKPNEYQLTFFSFATAAAAAAAKSAALAELVAAA